MLRLHAALLLAATCLLLSTGVAPEVLVTCDESAAVHRLSCDDSSVIVVQAALYGRADRETCGAGKPPAQLADTQCSQGGTTEILKNRCDGKRFCEVSTTTFRTTDPCVGTFKYLQTTFSCRPAIHQVTCEHSLAHLRCDEGQVIFLYGATYGRHDQTTCTLGRPASQTENIACSKPATAVSDSCSGKNSCVIAASNSVFGDPCVGTYKYLELAYTCEYPDSVVLSPQ